MVSDGPRETPPRRVAEINQGLRKAASLPVGLRAVAREASWLAERYRQLEPHRAALGKALDAAMVEAEAMRNEADSVLRKELL